MALIAQGQQAPAGAVPHVIHVGYAKAGSSLLQQWFLDHPEITFRQGGLGGFQDIYDLIRTTTHLKQPRCLVTSCEGLSAPRKDAGSINVDYSDMAAKMSARQENACQLLKTLFPNATILIVTRGFKGLMMSSYSQYVRTGGHNDLEDLFDTDGDLGCHYDALIALYREAFAGRVTVLPYELLSDDPGAFRTALEQVLGVGGHPFPQRRVNPSLSRIELRWYPRLARFIHRLHLGHRVRTAFVNCAFHNRLAVPIRWLDRLFPVKPVTPDCLPTSAMEGFRGMARTLETDPLYRPYADRYLFGPAPTDGRPDQ
ncbi:MAG: hypothetical protein ACI9YM_001389 [Brevundimonas sp.]|jgi:hypothetical protein|uniref:hypothetical protein n=1 Tax=Brevundimonas sp. TaxID=1871086 RepID=UPI0039E6F213